MLALIERFVKNLQLPQEIVDNLYQKRNDEQLKIFSLSIPTLLYPDTYVLAGRLLMYVHIKNCPRKIEEYIDILDGLLRPEIKDFMSTHSLTLNQLLDETYYKNFENHNILSASANINYLVRISHDESPLETPCQMMLRQAVQFYHGESIEKVIRCYYELINQDYVHASPTMFNAACMKNQMSSCFLLTLGDNLESLLYSGAGDVGSISKLQGGIGLSLNGIRHSNISNSGKSSGVLPFGKIYDATIACVNQGGKRNGAMTITLNDWHIDFLDFIRTRDNYTQNGIRFKQANICAYLSNLFMERVKNDQSWTFFCPAKAKLDGRKLLGTYGDDFEELYLKMEQAAIKSKEDFEKLDEEIKELEKIINSEDVSSEFRVNYHKKTIERVKMRKKLIDFKQASARDVYQVLCDMNNKSSMPYIVYRDPVNLKNNMSNIGVCEGLNLCLEITEPSTPDSIASCNLGHLNLKKYAKFVRDIEVTKENITQYYDFKGLGRATASLVENINKVIDFNYYPLDEHDEDGKVVKRGKISTPNFNNRPIGIGVSGLAEVFSHLNIAYDDELSFYINKLIFACMYYHALKKSVSLAVKDGEYSNFRTGECRCFIDGKWQVLKGSPLSNGYFQFDLWQQEAEYLKSDNRLNEKIYNPEDNQPVPPACWGEEEGSTWEGLRQEIMEKGVRNSMLMALMPTASSAQLLRNAETTEAHQTLVYSRKLVHGNFTAFSEPFVEDMRRLKLWNQEMIDFIMMTNGSIKDIDRFINDNRELFPEIDWSVEMKQKVNHLQKIHRGMYEISQKDTMQMARQRGIYVCQSQSLNIYLPEPDLKKIKAVHFYSNALQLKTGMYYLRQNPASQTSRFTVDIKIQEYHEKMKNQKKIVCTDDVCIMCQ